MTLTSTLEPGAKKKKAVMPPRLRKLVLVTHVTASLGWVGAVVVFLTISMIALSTDDITTMRGIYLVMEPIAWYVLVPLSFVSLITGIIQGLGTQYGLFRQYWVLYKLVITAFSTVILLIFAAENTSMFAEMAASSEAIGLPTTNPYQHGMLALAGLLVATVLGIYKPRGLTPFGKREAKRKQRITWTVVAAGIVVGLVIVSEVSPVNPLQDFMQLIPAPGGDGGGGDGGGGGGEGGGGGGH